MLFRNYNDILLPIFKPVFQSMVVSEKVRDRRFAAEFFAGIIRGSRYWTFEKLNAMWQWIGPILASAFEELTPDSFANWVEALQVRWCAICNPSLNWMICNPRHRIAKIYFKALMQYLLWNFKANFAVVRRSVFCLLPLLAHFENDSDQELALLCYQNLHIGLSNSVIDEGDATFVMDVIEKTMHYSRSWKSKVSLLKFCQVLVFSNLFVFENYDRPQKILQLINYLITHPQVEVRLAAAESIAGFIQCGYFSVSPSFIESLKELLREFRRTHQDNWDEHKKCFTFSQLKSINNLLVSPNYYV
ncbi:unnamed protein product [Anisakis simplex]|uniref:Proteasome activator complex subunit 4 (inferred by orthology to a human protein) n=1 Tax=Anisakis simplex TaxID=6269 RepID=A0A0M3J0W8_ANISI|nr:unnamed protein product [Anisakis simplex]